MNQHMGLSPSYPTSNRSVVGCIVCATPEEVRGLRKQCTMPTSINHFPGTSLWWPKSSRTHCSPTDDMKKLAQWNKEEWGVKGRKKPPLISPQGGSHGLWKEKYFPSPIRSPSPHTYWTTMDMLPRYPPTQTPTKLQSGTALTCTPSLSTLTGP